METIYDKFFRLLKEDKIGLGKNIEDAIPEFGEPTSVETVESPYTAKRYYWKILNHFYMKDGVRIKALPIFSKESDGLYIYTICGCIVEIEVIMNGRKTNGWKTDIDFLKENRGLTYYHLDEMAEIFCANTTCEHCDRRICRKEKPIKCDSWKMCSDFHIKDCPAEEVAFLKCTNADCLYRYPDGSCTNIPTAHLCKCKA